MSFIYNAAVIPAAVVIKFFLKRFNPKLQLREASWKDSLNSLGQLRDAAPRVWFHAASMGEFEQAKPVIEIIKKERPDIQVISSFFSPSGYDTQKNYKYTDAAVYLPFDTLKNVKYFLGKVKPDAAVFVRYEIWRNFLSQLDKNGTPVFLICATEPQSGILKSRLLMNFTKKNYSFFKEIFTVGEQHTDYFKNLDESLAVNTLSDTRFDRIVEKIKGGKKSAIIPGHFFPPGEFTVALGSSWPPDEDLFLEAAKKLEKDKGYRINMIVVPHEPTVDHIDKLKRKLGDYILLSDILAKTSSQKKLYNSDNLAGGKHVIVDSIGKLLKLYRRCDAAYVGGGFGAGVHSVAEPAGYGAPLACGPNYKNSPDAVNLKKIGALEIVENSDDIYNWLVNRCLDEKARKKTGKAAEGYILNSTGSSHIIADKILGIPSLKSNFSKSED